MGEQYFAQMRIFLLFLQHQDINEMKKRKAKYKNRFHFKEFFGFSCHLKDYSQPKATLFTRPINGKSEFVFFLTFQQWIRTQDLIFNLKKNSSIHSILFAVNSFPFCRVTREKKTCNKIPFIHPKLSNKLIHKK